MATIPPARMPSANFSESFAEVSPVVVQIELLEVPTKFPSKSETRGEGALLISLKWRDAEGKWGGGGGGGEK